ncbi:tyrosine-type recombinase/integrase [Streptomyces sp. NPDC051561]|uniref:tyrosine-type recombinase/integrase n=1 Tax=Streptomyces sp. NPDC051561 TaxID=3365658 RepID=UPI0037ACF3A4
MRTSFDVRVYSIRANVRAKGFSYTVRWKVAGEDFSKTHKTSSLADGFRSELIAAQNQGKPFNCSTGMPISMGAKASDGLSWYKFAVEYVDGKWPHIAGNTRKNLAKAMVAATFGMLRTSLPKEFDPVKVRRALRERAFNTKVRKAGPPSIDERLILEWVERNTLPVASLDDEDVAERFVTALRTLLDGSAAATSSVSRFRRLLNPAMESAIKRGFLTANPVRNLKPIGASGKVAVGIDKRSLLNPKQVAGLLDWIGRRPVGGRCYRAFFATMYYAGLRPEEAVALVVSDATLPEAGWGEFLVHQAQPEVGSQWTDSGEVHEERGLKGRAEGDTRPVPIHPLLVAILRDLIEAYGLKPGDILFPGIRDGGHLSGSVYHRVWSKAREAVLEEHEYNSPCGRRPYDLRHTCLTMWLNNSVPPAQVAEWAGNSVQVLLAIYARCINGQLVELQKRIEGPQSLELSEV